MFRQFEPPKIKRCFLVGCGRSGTSILGSLLGSMRKVTFSYEPEIFYGVYGKVDLNGMFFEKNSQHQWSTDVVTLILSRAELLTSTQRKIIFLKQM